MFLYLSWSNCLRSKTELYAANTPRDLIGTAIWAYDTGLMAEIAAVLGKDEDAEGYHRLLSNVKKAFFDR